MANLPVIGEDGYITSFAFDDDNGIKNFFDTFGFVVISNILSDDEVNKTIDDIWNQIEDLSKEMKKVDSESRTFWQKITSYVWDTDVVVNRNDENTHNKFWPFSERGIFSNVAQGPQMFENRQSPKVAKAFETVIGTDKLLVSLDRFGYIKPSNDIQLEKKPWLHWDLNPWFVTKTEKPLHEKTQSIEQIQESKIERWNRFNSALKIFLAENNGTTSLQPNPVQGLLSLSNNKSNEGGFMCIPGFHKKIESWAKNYQKYSDHIQVKVPLNDDDFSDDKIFKVPLKKGDLLIWSSTLPHCNYAGTKTRICQYIKMFPSDIYSDKIKELRSQHIRQLFPSGFKISPLGMHLFGEMESEEPYAEETMM